jgi:hypothetical protein
LFPFPSLLLSLPLQNVAAKFVGVIGEERLRSARRRSSGAVFAARSRSFHFFNNSRSTVHFEKQKRYAMSCEFFFAAHFV